MHTHSQKHRDIARSVLPSTRRGPRLQRERRGIHHRVRAAEHAVLHRIPVGDAVDRVDGFVDVPVAGWISDFVADRRAFDKTGPLVRWARRIVETDPRLRVATLEERLAHFRALLPDNLIGRHAVFHLRWALDPDLASRQRRIGADRAARATARADAIRAALDRIIAAGAVGEVNAALKAAFPAGYCHEGGRTEWRSNTDCRFHGHTDVERFATLATLRPDVGDVVLTVARRA